jgi:hypothetical protein
MTLRLAVTILLTLLITGCGKDPKRVKITEQNKDTFLTDIKETKGLTVEEVGLLMAVQMTSGMRKAFGGEDRKIVGKTVGELLVELKQEAIDKEKENKKQEQLAQETRAKEDARMAELRKAINLTVASKGFSEADYQSYITIKVVYENLSGKDIRAFQGAIQFTDLFGKEIFVSTMTISNPVKAGDKGQWAGAIKYNQFIDSQKALRTADLADLKIVWKPSGVIFTDGTKIGID